MKTFIGIILTVVGAYIFQFGFNLLSEKTKESYFKKFSEKMKGSGF